jgi:hypothetical protein
MESEPLTAELIMSHLLYTAGVSISAEEAQALLPLVAASRTALRRLQRFDVRDVPPAQPFDPLGPYR